MRVRPVALLDPPSARSFGMVPIVMAEVDDDVAPDQQKLVVCGLSPLSRHRASLDRPKLLELVAAHHARLLETERSIGRFTGIETDDPFDLVALVMGGTFRIGAKKHNVTLEQTPGMARSWFILLEDEGADLWILPSKEAHERLVAFLDVAEQEIKEIVSLMRWTLPLHEKTRILSEATGMKPWPKTRE
jgi:hypothetical protein